MNSPEKNRSALRYAGLGTQWMILLLLAAWAGIKLDDRTGWKVPVFIITLPLLALGISLWQLIKEVNKPKK